MTSEPCPFCLADVRVTAWDNMLGFATRCRQCGAYSGPPWTIRRVLVLAFASLFLNALVLFFIARPLRALLLIVMYAATVAALFGVSNALHSDAVFGAALCIVMIGPACLVAIEYSLHGIALDRRPLIRFDRSTSPRFIGLDDLERLRNELEIAIFHRQDYLALLAKGSYFLAALQAALAALEAHWLALTASLLLVGLAYTVKAHESRAFAALYTIFGVALAFDFVPREEPLPFAVIFFGIAMTATTIALARLRRARARIALGPAAHLQD